MVSQEIVDEVKRRLHIINEDDQKIKDLITQSHAYVQARCGNFELDNLKGKELVIERVRFIHNGYTEHFYDSFLPDLNSLRMELMNSVEETTDNSAGL